VNQQRSQVRIAALADTEQLDPAAAARLLRHQPQKGGKLPARAKAACVTDRRDHRRGREPPDAGDRGKPLTLHLPALPTSDPTLEVGDASRQGT
jgi:hypothetical protein